MISRLRRDNRLSHTRQKLLRLGQRQPQVCDVVNATRPADLHHLNTVRRTGHARVHHMPVSINRNPHPIDDPQVNIP